LPWWDDLALNRVSLVIACAIVLATASLAANGAADPVAPGRSAGSFPLAIATGVLVVAYFGLAHQYFAVRFGGRGRIYFALFLFFCWVLPLVSGTIVLASLPLDRERVSQVIFSLSPVAGIGLTAVAGGAEADRSAIQAAAITPALLFTFVFGSLLASARRRAYKEFAASADMPRRSMSAGPAETRSRDRATLAGVQPELESVG
jgi:hypothetical protein